MKKLLIFAPFLLSGCITLQTVESDTQAAIAAVKNATVKTVAALNKNCPALTASSNAVAAVLNNDPQTSGSTTASTAATGAQAVNTICAAAAAVKAGQ